MYDVYIKKIWIDKVRHLERITIPIADQEKKHLILTGKNGSGKTSLLQALSKSLDYWVIPGDLSKLVNRLELYREKIYSLKEQKDLENEISQQELENNSKDKALTDAKAGLKLDLNIPLNGLHKHFSEGDFILAYYEATRKFDAIIPKHVEKVALKDNYGIGESPRNEFVKYILDLKMTEALAMTSGKNERAEQIRKWFENFEKLLKQIFDDDSVRLMFDEETFAFTLHQDGREPFDFTQLSDGFSAILDIVVDIMVRMEKHLNGGLTFDLPGIVLIDEIETHLHLELQKNVLSFLTSVFPNIQFIVSTHSPFILSSASNAVIYDLENNTLVENGLTSLPYDGIVRGYFEVDDLSKVLRSKYDRYRELTGKQELSDEEMEEIAGLELYLDEIPDYLALGITTEYKRLKAEFEKREDL
ncbi:MAG: AAA family ATPase [Lachnospiraceae bacterium]|nr:AAA family ATPase [Lachnospiraceae bacterium]